MPDEMSAKYIRVQNAIVNFSDHYDTASCDMCCGGGDEHMRQLQEYIEQLEQGYNIDLDPELLFEKD